jgi:hypothetical protein
VLIVKRVEKVIVVVVVVVLILVVLILVVVVLVIVFQLNAVAAIESLRAVPCAPPPPLQFDTGFHVSVGL